LAALAAQTATQSRQRPQEILKDIDLPAGYPCIQLSFLQFSFGQRLETVLFKLTRYKRQNDLYSRISLISLDGELILSVAGDNERRSAANIDRDRMRLAALTDNYSSGVLPDHPEGPLLIFTKRVYDFEHPTVPVGLLAFYIRLDSLTRFVEELDESSDTIGFVYDHYLETFLQRRPLPLDARPYLPKPVSSEIRIVEHEGYKLFLAGIPDLHWTVGFTLPTDVLFGDILALKRTSLSFALAIAAFALLTTLFFVRRITDPIQQLTRGAQEFSEGNLAHRISIQGEGEMRRLGEEFNAMAQKLAAREKQLRTVDRLASLGILAAGVAHEVRNPLAGMKSCAQLMQRKAISPEVAGLAGDINEEIQRLDAIVRQLLEFARPGEAARAQVALAPILERSLEMTRSALEKADIDIVRETTAVPEVFVDPGQVQQILLNLILNAAQAMPTGGALQISLQPEAEEVMLAIADSGCGIAPEHLNHIFDPFFTLNPGGTGLGLSVAHALMEENAIRWQVTSRPGEGTVFRLLFPRVEKE
jgi:signal transduction histidine kinase